MNWFSVDKNGLGQQAEQLGKGRLIGELIQNALDEDGVTTVEVSLMEIAGRPLADLVVKDDSPTGFRDLSHAYTLFANSHKRSDPTKRGQFNFGEKLVLSVCEQATISTTTGTVVFDAQKGRSEHPRKKRDRGSVFEGRMRMTRSELADAMAYVKLLLVPDNITVTVNGERITPRTPVLSFQTSLPSMVADDQGIMRERTRQVQIDLHEPRSGEVSTLYEMGLPIVELSDKWHVNVHQKVPLNRDRDNVKPAYLNALRVAVVNAAHELLTPDDAVSDWCKSAGGNPNCSNEAVKQLIGLRFGKNVASNDPSDPEAVKKFQSQGGTIVSGLSKHEWANVKRAGAVLSAGKICPTPKPYSNDPNATAVEMVQEKDWTPTIRNVVNYSMFLAKELMQIEIEISIVNTSNNFLACYGGKRLDFNLQRLGHQWFNGGITEDVDRLLIHEFGHEYSGDHLSSEYHQALCRLGARMKQLAMEKPDEIRRFLDSGITG